MIDAPPVSGQRGEAVWLWLWTFFAGSIALGAVLNVSATHRIVFHRYSIPWFILVCLSLSCFGVLAAGAVRKTLRPSLLLASRRRSSPYVMPLALAAASWGCSLLSQYRTDTQYLSHLFSGEFFGATQTAGVVLEYLAQAFAALAVMLSCVSSALRANAAGRRAGSRIPLLVAALVGTFLLGEGGMRLVNVAWPRTQGEPTKPARIWHQRYVVLNRDGYRDRELAGRIDGRELRVLVIGDSFTYGVGIRDPRDRFTEILEARLLSKGTSPSVRVFNAGRPDSHSEDHLRMLDGLLWLDSDVVVLAYVFNDIEHLRPRAVHPAFHPPSALGRFSAHRLLMLNSHLFDQILLRYRASRSRRNAIAVDQGLSAYSDGEVLRRHVDLLVRFVERTRARGVAFRLVPFDVAVRAGPAYEERYHRFVRAAVERGIPVWSLDGLFDALPYEALTVNGWDHHPNERAHRLVGEFLAAHLLREEANVGPRAGQLDHRVKR